MRTMLRFTIPVEKGNEAAANGSLLQTISHLVEEMKADAAYFHLDAGKRAGTIFFEAADQSQIPAICEPLFASLNASIEIQPAVSLQELRATL